MAKATVQVTDKKFRIVVPQDIRTLENIGLGDFIEIDVKKIEKPKNIDYDPDDVTIVGGARF